MPYIYSYNVKSLDGTSWSDGIYKAFTDAILNEKVDIINMSLGSEINDMLFKASSF